MNYELYIIIIYFVIIIYVTVPTDLDTSKLFPVLPIHDRFYFSTALKQFSLEPTYSGRQGEVNGERKEEDE